MTSLHFIARALTKDVLMRYIIISALTVVLFVTSAICEETVAVEWGGSWKGQSPLFDESSQKIVTPGFHTFTFDDALSWRPQAFAGGEDVGDFFIAISSSVGSSPAVPHIMRLDAYQGRALAQILIKGSQQHPPQMRGMFFLTDAQFVDSDIKTAWRFSESSVISFSGIIDGMIAEARWLVRDGQAWYVSEALLAAQQSYNKLETRELENPEAVRWGEYHPDGAPLEKAPSSFAEHVFDNITAIGVYWDSYDSSIDVGGTSFSRFAVESLVLRAHK